jgi:predicted O-methyltransferase YrrM
MLRQEHIAHCRMFATRLEMARAFAEPGTIGAEVGVWDGDFSTLLLQLVAPKELHLIDIEIREQLKMRFADRLSGPVITVREGDSSKVLSTYPDGFFDWIYIDADPSYDGVKRDADVSIKKMNHDGVLFFNNYTIGDHNYPDGFFPYGVIEVVNNLCLYDGFEMIGFGFHPQMYCDVAIRRRA